MEPLNCVVDLKTDSCEIWTGTQFQTGDRMAAATIAGLKPEQVSIHTTFLGGGFGRRANPANDFVGEAVHVAKAVRLQSRLSGHAKTTCAAVTIVRCGTTTWLAALTLPETQSHGHTQSLVNRSSLALHSSHSASRTE